MKFSTLAAAVATVASFASTEAYSATSKKADRTFGILYFGGGDELTRCRLDPIVNPGGVAAHMHSIFGGNAFSASMPGDTATSSSCTTTRVKKDKSNYWVPSLYFKSPTNGTLYPVPLHYAKVYYFFDPTNDDIKAFPKGFRMRSGDPSLRAPPSAAKGNDDPSKGTVLPVKWTCPRSDADKAAPLYPTDSDGTKGCGVQDPDNTGEGWGFPDKDCSGFASPLRADIHFPSCVNPNVDVENWKENTAFPTDNKAWGKDCPEGWIHVPHIFMEVYWNTALFKGMWTQGQGTQPWVLSNGDTTGYSLHADFLNGWDSPTLQKLIDSCNAGHAGLHTCLPAEDQTTEEEMKNCKLKCPLDESTADKFWSPMPDNKLFGNNELSGYQAEPYVAPGGVSVAAVPKPASSSAVAPKPSTTFAYVPVVAAANNQPTTTPAAVYEPQPVAENYKVVIVTTHKIRTKKVIKTVIVQPDAQTVAAAAAPSKSCDKPRRRHARHVGLHQHGSF